MSGLNGVSLHGIDFNKYVVIKQDDLYKYTSEEDKIDLCRILKTIRDGRVKGNKNTSNQYFVINIDENYAGEVIEILRKNRHWGWVKGGEGLTMDFEKAKEEYKELLNNYPNLTKDEFKWMKALSYLLISDVNHILESWDNWKTIFIG